MKGIILAGGSGTRLYPSTKVVSKQLLTIYDKPMIYYPLSTLKLAGIKEILIITTSKDIEIYKSLFLDGSDLGLKIVYAVQEKPEGLSQAFIIGKNFIKDDNVCLILGDNIFFGNGLTELLVNAKENTNKDNVATIFGYYVENPQRYGVVEFDSDNQVISIKEKPKNPKSNYAITGIYFYPNNVIDYVLNVKPSKRGELEISSLNEIYLNKRELKVEIMHRGFAWLDTGTSESMLEASNLIYTIEKRQGLKVSCLEEISLKKGLISQEKFNQLTESYSDSPYKDYLKSIKF